MVIRAPIRNSHQPIAMPAAVTAQEKLTNSGHQLCGLKKPVSLVSPISPVPSAMSPCGLSSGRSGSRRPVNSSFRYSSAGGRSSGSAGGVSVWLSDREAAPDLMCG
jgi:hypothetical protein